MGVPKFFRWISERYPLTSALISNYQIPLFDCLYLDMNGIIHPCAHPNDNDLTIKLTEEEIFENIFNYIDYLMLLIKPQELIYLAVDGVAPRAKMNQQRSRRFKSAKERKLREINGIEKGYLNEGEKQFDSNAITPGTKFMERLDEKLKQFIETKVSTDPYWSRIKVIYSGHQTPGEGEHKIQNFIRYRRTLSDYNPRTRHCLYGLDADLIILGLVSHEPNFALLREDVIIDHKNKKNISNPTETKFYLFYVSLMRDYIRMEFESLKSILNDEYDNECIIDDWILMTFLVGNDFIPHLPNFHIHSHVLTVLWTNYIATRPKMKGYMIERGVINVPNFLIFMESLKSFEWDMFITQYEDMKWMTSKKGQTIESLFQTNNDNKIDDFKSIITNDEIDTNTNGTENDIVAFFDDTLKLKPDIVLEPLEDVTMKDSNIQLLPTQCLDAIETEAELYERMYKFHKRNYYESKFGLKYDKIDFKKFSYEYLHGLQWIASYYFSGVCSWSWYYPFHYTPYLSDIVNYHSTDLNDQINKFDLSNPFTPYEQLLGVLPSDSKDLLPEPLQCLMSSNSPIIDFYPHSFLTDINGKKQEWEAVVLIPFVDEKRLIDAMKEPLKKLTTKELLRNKHVEFNEYFLKDDLFIIKPQEMFKHHLDFDIVKYGLLFDNEPDNLDLIRNSGFPTLFSTAPNKINFNYKLEEKASIKLFETTSTKPCWIINILPKEYNNEELKILNYLDKIVYINWPQLSIMKVNKIFYKGSIYDKDSKKDPENYKFILKRIIENKQFYLRRGLHQDPGNDVYLFGNIYCGYSYNFNSNLTLSTDLLWKNDENFVPEQLAILPDPNLGYKVPWENINTGMYLKNIAAIGSQVIIRNGEYFGTTAKILEYQNENLNVQIEQSSIPNYPTYRCQTINKKLSIEEIVKRYPCGLSEEAVKLLLTNLFLRKNEVKRFFFGFGIYQRINENMECDELLCEVIPLYMEAFPEIKRYLENYTPNGTVEDVFGNDSRVAYNRLNELANFRKTMITNKEKFLTVGLEELKYLESYQYDYRTVDSKSISLHYSDVYFPHQLIKKDNNDNNPSYFLFDRVISVTTPSVIYPVPLGSYGTVIGFYYPKYIGKLEILFDKEFNGAMPIRGSSPRCFICPQNYLIKQNNINTNTNKESNNKNTETSILIRDSSSQSLTEEIASTEFIDLDNQLPPDPPKEFLVDAWKNQQQFIQQCATKYNQQLQASTVVTNKNCPVEFQEFMQWCSNVGLSDPKLYISQKSMQNTDKITHQINRVSFEISFESNWVCLSPVTINKPYLHEALEVIRNMILENFPQQMSHKTNYHQMTPNTQKNIKSSLQKDIKRNYHSNQNSFLFQSNPDQFYGTPYNNQYYSRQHSYPYILDQQHYNHHGYNYISSYNNQSLHQGYHGYNKQASYPDHHGYSNQQPYYYYQPESYQQGYSNQSNHHYINNNPFFNQPIQMPTPTNPSTNPSNMSFYNQVIKQTPPTNINENNSNNSKMKRKFTKAPKPNIGTNFSTNQ